MVIEADLTADDIRACFAFAADRDRRLNAVPHEMLFEENLSPKLPRLLAALFPDSVHARECGLPGFSDENVWEYARDHGFTIISKDSDFQ